SIGDTEPLAERPGRLEDNPAAAKGGESDAIQTGKARTATPAHRERDLRLLGQDQLVVAGGTQAIELVAMLDDEFTLPLEQGAAIDNAVSRHPLDRALRQVEGTGTKQDGLSGHRGDSVLGTELMIMILNTNARPIRKKIPQGMQERLKPLL